MKPKTLVAFASILLVANAGAATTFLSANFDGTTLTDYSGNNLAQLTKANLDAGTTVGDWTVNQAQNDANYTNVTTGYGQKSIQGVSGGNTTNKVLNFGSNLTGTSGAANPFLTANLTSTLSLTNAITFSFDYAAHAPDGNTTERGGFFTGVDGSGNRLFQLFISNTSTAGDPTEGHRIGYINSAGALTYLGSAGDITGSAAFNSTWDPSLMQTISVTVGASDYSISLGASALASGIAFRDASAAGLATIQLGTNNNFTSGWIDNMSVTQVPEPSSALLIGLAGLGFMGFRCR